MHRNSVTFFNCNVLNTHRYVKAIKRVRYTRNFELFCWR